MKENPDQEVVIVLTHKQAATLILAATAGFMSPLMLDRRDDPNTKEMFVTTAECVGIINDAMGNTPDPSFTALVKRLKEEL